MSPVFPLFCLAPLSWYAEALKADTLVLGADENFPKQTLRNRIIIPAANDIRLLSIPVAGETKHGPYRQVRISYAENWLRLWLQTLDTAYGKSPFYEFYDYRIKAVLEQKYEYLFDLNLELLKLSFDLIGLDTAIELAEKRFEENDIFWEKKSESLVPYTQVFSDRHGFQPHVSITDLIFNKGPNAVSYLSTQSSISS